MEYAALCLSTLQSNNSNTRKGNTHMTNETDKIATQLTTLAGYMWNADEIGRQLDRGMICAHMYGGQWYRARRNGATKLWKTRPADFRIPIKAGFKACGYIERDNLHNFAHVDDLDALGIKHT